MAMLNVLFVLFASCSFLNTTFSLSDLGFKRAVVAETTCGTPPEGYYKTWQGSLMPRDRRMFICNASDFRNMHPPSYLLDGTNLTFWQSTAGVDTANITINLTSNLHKNVFVEKIDLYFGAYQRPGQMAFFKSVDNGITYQPWHFYVNFPSECNSVFQRQSLSRPYEVESILCMMYKAVVPLAGNETVSFNTKGGRDSRYSKRLQAWMNITNLRIQFSGLYRKFDILSLPWHHYSLKEIAILGYCPCNGHGSQCVANVTNGERQCRCQNNACGPLCERCCPAYNQHPWKQGRLAPFEVDTSAACQACNCHGHSSRCYYNETIAAQNMSLDTSGRFSGGGVCLDCQHNTTGINCEQCIRFFYRPVGKNPSDADACVECNCDLKGTRQTTNVTYLDCVRDETRRIPGMRAGDCYCKQNVFGRPCNQCRPGFYNLTSDNNLGCHDCSCFLNGTVNGSNVCSANQTGQCPCKQNTIGRACDSCKDTFFNLQGMNDVGCSACLCDRGGSLSQVCNKTNGACSCKNVKITGRRCNRLVSQYYYPNLHFMTYTVRRIQVMVGFAGVIRVPSVADSTGLYWIVVVYTSTRQFNGQIVVKRNLEEHSASVGTHSNCLNRCYVLINKQFTLSPGDWEVLISFNNLPQNHALQLNIQSVVLLPSEFVTPTILGNERQDFQRVCNITTNLIQRGSPSENYCKERIFTITMGYLEQPLNCSCNRLGSFNNSCEMFAGQCPCKPGVGGRTCDRCLPGFYNFTDEGCTACGCFGDNKVCNVNTGQCVCPQNVTGRTCNTCIPFNWGLNATTGCQACGCNSVGSLSQQCNLTTGLCSCKTGVRGATCFACLDGYTHFSSSGCDLCNCSVSGSLSSVCNKTNGACQCKRNTIGSKCDQCREGSFHLSTQHATGCLDCICMGVTQNCSSLTGIRITSTISPSGWMPTTKTNVSRFPSVVERLSTGGMVVTFSTSVITGHTEPLYWRAPSSFLGNVKVASYGGSFGFTLFYETSAQFVLYPMNQTVILSSEQMSIAKEFDNIIGNRFEQRSVPITEFGWKYQGTERSVERAEFLKVIASVRDILISTSPMRNSTSTYRARIGNITLSSSQESNTGNLDVEKCDCGPRYTGLSCERCAPGYKRSNNSLSTFFGACIPCRCNRHSSTCDSNTGYCQGCQHNTTGLYCEKCRDGYYGNATEGTSGDCKECPCKPPSASTPLCRQSFNGSVLCLNCSVGFEGEHCQRCSSGYYGNPLAGIPCQRCSCFNNSFVCNRTTAACLNCNFNTTGDRCQWCKGGWYGDATSRSCKGCECSIVGAYSNVCNWTSGQCACKRNVVGRNCSTCAPLSYGLNNDTGCLDCNCSAVGALSLQCNDTGYCRCANLSKGAKCDRCVDGFYGLPARNCSECNCNSTGAMNASCSAIAGQCFCKPGVSLRDCSGCAKQHTNFSASGCDACPGCTQLLQKKIDKLVTDSSNAYGSLIIVQNFTILERNLSIVRSRVNHTQGLKTLFDERIATLQRGIQSLTSNSLNKSINRLNANADILQNELTAARATANSTIERFNDIKTEAEDVGRLILRLNTTTSQMAENLSYLHAQAAGLYQMAVIFNRSEILSYREGIEHARNNLTAALVFKNRSTLAKQRIIGQKQELHFIRSNFTSIERRYFEASSNYRRILSNYTRNKINVVTVQRNLSSTEAMVNNTSVLLANATRLLVEANALYFNASLSLTESRMQLAVTNNSLYTRNGLISALGQLNRTLASLESSVIALQPLAVTTEASASNLTAEAQSFDSIFQATRGHGSNAVNAVNRYIETTQLVNQSLALSKQANQSVHNASLLLLASNRPNLTESANSSVIQARMLVRTVSYQQQLSQGLTANLSRVIGSFQDASSMWITIDSQYNILRLTFDSLSRISEFGAQTHSIERAAENVSRLTNETEKISSKLHGDILQQRLNLTSTNNLLLELNRTILNASTLVSETETTETEINHKLTGSPSPIQHVNNMTSLLQEYNTTTKPLLDARLKSIREKLNSLKSRISKLNIAVRLNGSQSLSYGIQNQSMDSQYSELQVDFKTTQRHAILLSVGDQGSSTSALALKVVYSRVAFDYSTGGIKHRLINWAVDTSDGNWKRAYATRFGNFSRLTVHDLSSNYSRTYSSSMRNVNFGSRIRLSSNASVLIGDSKSFAERNESAQFQGCIGNIVVNTNKIALLRENDMHSGISVCNGSQSSSSHTIRPGVTFFGNGFISHRLHNFSVFNNSATELTFRSMKDNGTLFVVKNTTEDSVYKVSLINGRIMVALYSSLISLEMLTNQSYYGNGNWYRLYIERRPYTILLSAQPAKTTAGRREENITRFTRIGLLQNLSYIIIGNNVIRSWTPKEVFAGCLASLRVNRRDGFDLETFDMNDSRTRIASMGISTDGCLGQVQKGIQFLDDSFSNLQLTSRGFRTLDFSFSTSQPSAVLVYAMSRDIVFYLALYHGNIFLQYQNITSRRHMQLSTFTQTLNDGQPHRLRVAISGSVLRIDIDTGRVSQSRMLTTDLPNIIPVETLYVGGINTTRHQIPSNYPVVRSFIGGMPRFILDGRDWLMRLVWVSKQVSAAGIPRYSTPTTTPLPTTPPPTTAPPTCTAAHPPLQVSSNLGWIGFGPRSYLALQPPQEREVLAYFNENFVITLEFRAFSSNGILFYAAKSGKDNSQYVALELVNGKMVYHFKAGQYVNRITTTLSYNNAVWTKVYLLRISEFGAMLVDSTKEYHNNRVQGAVPRMQLSLPLYLGGIPNRWNSSALTARTQDFFGCIRKLSLQETSKTFDINLRNHALYNMSLNTRQCYERVEPTVRFGGNGFALFNLTSRTSSILPIVIVFRTTARSGLLWSINETETRKVLTLEQRLGQLVLTVVNATQTWRLVWRDRDRIGQSNSSYVLCDNRWHTASLRRISSNYTLSVDSRHPVTSSIGHTDLRSGQLLVAGSPASRRIGFAGCIRSLTFNGIDHDFSRPFQGKNIVYGCTPTA